MPRRYKKHIRRHSVEYIFVGIACITAIFGHDDIKRQMDALSMDRSRISESASQIRSLEESAELTKQKAEIADQRFKDGCTIVVAANSPKNLATLVKGQPVYDRTSKAYLPEGTVVCDGNGTTGILTNNNQGIPVVDKVASTGNRQLATETVKKIHGAKVYYYTPSR